MRTQSVLEPALHSLMPKKSRAPKLQGSPLRSRSSARYATLAEVLAHFRKRDQKVYDALLIIFTHGDGRVLTALGVLIDFVVAEATARPRRAR